MNHKIIFSYLEPVSEKWLEIAQALGMSEEAQHAISKASTSNFMMCCSRMVEELLVGCDVSLSWYSLTEALRALNMEQLAEEILLHWGMSLFAFVSSTIYCHNEYSHRPSCKGPADATE